MIFLGGHGAELAEIPMRGTLTSGGISWTRVCILGVDAALQQRYIAVALLQGGRTIHANGGENPIRNECRTRGCQLLRQSDGSLLRGHDVQRLAGQVSFGAFRILIEHPVKHQARSVIIAKP